MIIVQGSLMVGDAYFQVIQIFMLYGDCSLRPISFAFVVERTFATVKREIYEKREYKWVSYGLIAIIVSPNSLGQSLKDVYNLASKIKYKSINVTFLANHNDIPSNAAILLDDQYVRLYWNNFGD